MKRKKRTRNQTGINQAKGRKVILATQLILSGFIFVTEVVGNTMLYVTRSQGYGPDTIVEKLLRYLVMTTAINVIAIIAGQIVVNRSKSLSAQRYALIIATEVICTNVAFSHYQFSETFGMFAIPIILSILYEDVLLCNSAFGIGVIGMGISISARAHDMAYNQDIFPEMAIAVMFLVAIFLFARIVLNSLETRREELDQALVGAERAKYLSQVEELSLHTLSTLAQTIDAKDRYTNGHSYRVAEYSYILAASLGWPEEECIELRKEAMLHDIGKIGIPDYVLNKPGRLTDVEFKVMKTHTTLGFDILEDMIMLPNAADVAHYHHERYDGKGYPEGRQRDEIPPHARVVGIADAYDAMSSDRIYRKALSRDAIREQLLMGRGTQWDPEYIDVFLELFDENELVLKNTGKNEEITDGLKREELEDDFRLFLKNLPEQPLTNGPMEISREDFSRIYDFIRQMEKRYQHRFELVMIDVKATEGVETTDIEDTEASNAMEVAIKNNIRSVDIYMRYGNMRHLVILMNANANVDMIVQRAFLDFYKLHDTKKYLLTYEI